MKLTESQRIAVSHRGSHLLLAASAGSGKTEVLARRAVDLIADPQRPCEARRLLVVTFTRAAAAELRIRIARMLRSAADAAPDGDLRTHLLRQSVLIDAADIGTIDAWCGRLVREHFAEAGVDPAFTMLGAEEARLLRAAAMQQLFELVHRPPASNTDTSTDADASLTSAAGAWISRHRRPDAEFLNPLIEHLNAFREQLVNPAAWFAAQQKSLLGDDDALRSAACAMLSTALARECEFQSRQLGGASGDPGARSETLPSIVTYRAALDEWQTRLAAPDGLSGVADSIAGFKFTKPPADAAPVQLALLEEVQKRWHEKRLKPLGDPAAVARVRASAPQAAALIRTLLMLESRYVQLLAREKQRRAAYEFGDVQRMALDLLGTPSTGASRSPTPIAVALRERYAHVLVDEFQDTSPVQVELLRLVARDEPGRGNAFYVGDLKQSIYAFRQAEPRLFAGLVDLFSASQDSGRVQFLSDNFRSHATLVDGLNRMFAMLLAREFGGTDFAADEHLAAGRDEIGNPTLDAAPRIAIEVLEEEKRRAPAATTENAAEPNDDDSEDVAIDKIDREAALTARRIKAMLAEQVQIPERRADGTLNLRPLKLGDVAILLRAAAINAARVATVLRSHGIPCITQGRESILREIVVRDARNVLALLANRRRELEMAAYLRGPLVELTPAELFRIRRRGPARGDFLACVDEYARGGDDDALALRVRAALATLDRWSTFSREEDLPALLRRILRESGLLHFAHGMPGGAQRVALLRGLERLAAECAASGRIGVADFVEYLDALADLDLDPGVPVAAEDDAVRIMTIHASKGLEFPIVFLLHAGARFNRRTLGRDLHIDESSGLGLRFADYTQRTEIVSAAHTVIRQSAWERELAENLRLLYVATTRARERLVIVGHAAEGCWAGLRTRFNAANAFTPPADAITAPPLITRLSAGSMLEWVLLGVAAAGLEARHDAAVPSVGVTTIRTAELPRPAETKTPPATDATTATGREADPWDSTDDDWLATALRNIVASDGAADESTQRPRALPSVLSVTALKELRLRDSADDTAATLDDFTPHLAWPKTPGRDTAAPPAVDDPAAVGTASHRFLELADLTNLDSPAKITAQIDRLCAAGRLTAAAAALVETDDVAWFAQTDLGRALAANADRVRREVPFVYAVPVDAAERIIVRGVIDCLFDTGDELVILDYKTDRVASAAQFDERVRGYRIQLGLYAAAAQEIFARRVRRAALVFLRARRVIDVQPQTPPLAEMLRSRPAC